VISESCSWLIPKSPMGGGYDTVVPENKFQSVHVELGLRLGHP